MSDPTPPAGTPTPRTPGGTRLWEPPAPAALQAMLSDYTVQRLVGQGGMGAVYQARQISLNRPVALKIITDDLEDSDDFDETEVNYVERFKNEARAMARLAHSGIVAVYDFGQTSNGLLYIGMEYVEGTDVARILEQQERLTPKHALAITAQVCVALACAHERGIIHRDIKPANILIDPDDVVKVADFGLAKVHGSDGQTLGLTQSGIAMGTLHYMAPEALILGTAVDHRADIYAVGVMLYQMLTGKVPHGMFKPPSKHLPGLDPRYDAMISKAMRADRDRRYQTIQELHRDLCEILTGGTLKVEATAPKTVPKQALRQNLAEVKARLSPLLAKIKPLAHGLPEGLVVVVFVLLVAATVALVGYAATSVARRIWHPQSDVSHSASEVPNSTPTAPAAPLEVKSQPALPPVAKPVPALVPAAKPATPPVAKTSPITPPSKSREWTDAEGAYFEAELLQMVNGHALFKGKERSFSMPLGKLSVTSQEQANQLTQGGKPSATTTVATMDASSPAVSPPIASVAKALPTVLQDDPRLAKLEADFDKFWRDEMQQPYIAELSDIRMRYVQVGLIPARDQARKSGRQKDQQALDAEIVLVYSGAKIPAASAGNAPSPLVELRRLYHKRLSEYVASRITMTPPIIRAQLRGFDAYIKELDKAGRLEEAERVRAVRKSKAAFKLK